MGPSSDGESVLCISGVKVSFPPFKPFPGQIALMNKVLKAVQHNQNALLESPTGTGKTLALLCSTLSWQSHAFTLQQQQDAQDDADEEANESPSQTQPTTQLSKAKTTAAEEDDFVSPKAKVPSKKEAETTVSETFKPKRCPKIFFASRTQRYGRYSRLDNEVWFIFDRSFELQSAASSVGRTKELPGISTEWYGSWV